MHPFKAWGHLSEFRMECSVRRPPTRLSRSSPSACESAAHIVEVAASLKMSVEYREPLINHSRRFSKLLVAGVEAYAIAAHQLSRARWTSSSLSMQHI